MEFISQYTSSPDCDKNDQQQQEAKQDVTNLQLNPSPVAEEDNDPEAVNLPQKRQLEPSQEVEDESQKRMRLNESSEFVVAPVQNQQEAENVAVESEQSQSLSDSSSGQSQMELLKQRLQKAILQLFMDRGGEPANFQTISQAFSMGSDPNTRFLKKDIQQFLNDYPFESPVESEDPIKLRKKVLPRGNCLYFIEFGFYQEQLILKNQQKPPEIKETPSKLPTKKQQQLKDKKSEPIGVTKVLDAHKVSELCTVLSQIQVQDEKYQEKLSHVEQKLKELKQQKHQKTKLFNKIIQMDQSRNRLKQEIDEIKGQPNQLGPKGIEDLKRLKLQQDKLEKAVQKRKDACIDMLAFFNDKLNNKAAFAQLLQDNDIIQKIYCQENEDISVEHDNQNQEADENDLMVHDGSDDDEEVEQLFQTTNIGGLSQTEEQIEPLQSEDLSQEL